MGKDCCTSHSKNKNRHIPLSEYGHNCKRQFVYFNPCVYIVLYDTDSKGWVLKQYCYTQGLMIKKQIMLLFVYSGMLIFFINLD